MNGEAVVKWRIEDGMAHVELCRPTVLNVIDEQVCHAIISSFDAIERHEEISVVLLSGGSCRAFSAGADLTFMRALSGSALRRFIELTWRVGARIADSRLLSIACLRGYALGGGAELALACDMRIASEDARIGFPEMGYGSVPGSGAAQRLQTLVGPARAMELMAGGRHVEAQEAAAIGLVNRFVSGNDPRDSFMEWAAGFSSRPAEAIRYMKAAMRVPADAVTAAALHGLISGACQGEAGYRARTQAFDASRSAN